jgi:hypothetical protein
MQDENAAGSSVVDVADGVVLVVPVVATLATAAPGEPPPQAEASSAMPIVAMHAASAVLRRAEHPLCDLTAVSFSDRLPYV